MATLSTQEMAEMAGKVAASQDRDAFAALFDYFAPRINAYLRKLGLEAAQAEELTQEVMLTLWRKAALFDSSKSNLSTWLFRIARNRRIDALRRDKSGKLDPDDPYLQPEPLEAADKEVDAKQRDLRIRAAMAELPSEQVETIRLAFFLGLSHSQIAEETGLPIGTVKSRIRLAFSRLRVLLERDDLVDTDLND